MGLHGQPLIADPLVASLLAVVAAAYMLAGARLAGRGTRWPFARTVAFLGGQLAIAVALASPLAVEDERFPIHVIQHLLLGMVAPLLLVLSAPVTLLLRALPRPYRQRAARLLHYPPLRRLSHPLVGAALSIGAMYALYLTPLYAATLRHPPLHLLMHAHFLLAGYLFSWAVVGLDPIPHRASLPTRAVVLVLALGAHGTLAKLLYADGASVAGLQAAVVSVRDWRLGTQIMWYGGDVVDVALVFAFFLQWYIAGGRRLARARHARPAPSVTGVRKGALNGNEAGQPAATRTTPTAAAHGERTVTGHIESWGSLCSIVPHPPSNSPNPPTTIRSPPISPRR
jgi:putative membrane protein